MTVRHVERPQWADSGPHESGKPLLQNEVPAGLNLLHYFVDTYCMSMIGWSRTVVLVGFDPLVVHYLADKVGAQTS